MFNQLLERIARGIDERQIPYMVIGGQAVLIYGEPRLTRDIDITLGVGPERLGDVLALADASGWRLLVEKPDQLVQRTILLKNSDLDLAYVRGWLAEFDRSLGENYLRTFENLARSSS